MCFKLELALMDLGNKCVNKMTECLYKSQFKKRNVYSRVYNVITLFTNKLYHHNWDYFKLGE